MTKRIFDIVVSLLALIFLFPVILITSILIAFNMGRPIIFKQSRPGLNGRLFDMYKFRSMKNELDEEGKLRRDADRLTKLGRFLRNTSLDELPELWNVLIGDMSIVGPRPLLSEYLPLYSKEQARRHDVRPGITGWAQIHGRNSIAWAKKFDYDVWYVNNQSFLLDLKIILLTVKKVFQREGINEQGEATMSKFTGNSK